MKNKKKFSFLKRIFKIIKEKFFLFKSIQNKLKKIDNSTINIQVFNENSYIKFT